MKKWLSILLILCFSCYLLLGCDASTISGNTKPTSGSDASDSIFTVKNPGSSLITYDPDRQIYIACENVYLDMYRDSVHSSQILIQIISKNPLNAEEISVSIPIESEYKFMCADISDFYGSLQQKDVGNDNQISMFPYYLFQIYAGTDWKELGEVGKTDILALDSLRKALASEWAALKETDIPFFYAYTCAIYFPSSGKVEESFQGIDFNIGGQTYHLDIGQVNIHASNIPLKYPDDAESLDDRKYVMLRDTWSDGRQEVKLSFTASEEMTITGLWLLHNEMLKDILMNVSVTTGGMSYSATWDENEPIYLFAGDSVHVSVSFTDSRLTNLSACTSYYLALEYETKDGAYCKIAEKYVHKDPNLHELYAIVFKGLDVESYYKDYYLPLYKNR